MKHTNHFIVLLVIAILSTPLSSQSPTQQTQSSAWVQLTQSMLKMHMAAGAIHTSGDADIDFARLMLAHHQAAIEMSKAQLLYGKDPQMRRLAQEIVTDQQSEIELMQLWLTQHVATQQPSLDPTRSNQK